VSFILAVFLAVAQAQAPPPPSPESTVLTYERFLRESEEQHRKYIETLLTGAAALVTLFTAYLGWLNWKTRKELLAEIQAEYHEAAEKVAGNTSPKRSRDSRSALTSALKNST
jgi:hypothetical protein